MTRNPNTLLVDSGFFFALFDPRDQHHAAARDKQEWLEMFSFVMPWPILYETINTTSIATCSILTMHLGLCHRP